MSNINAKENPLCIYLSGFVCDRVKIGKKCNRDPLIGLPHPQPRHDTQGGAVNLSQTSQLRPTSITHSLLGLHSIVTQSTVVFTDSQFPDPASPASHARTSQWLPDQIALPPTMKYN